MHTHHEKQKPPFGWLRVGIVSGVCGCFFLLAALAWYVVAIEGSALAEIQSEAQIQSGYLMAIGQRVQATIRPASSAPAK